MLACVEAKGEGDDKGELPPCLRTCRPCLAHDRVARPPAPPIDICEVALALQSLTSLRRELARAKRDVSFADASTYELADRAACATTFACPAVL
jgi:hypothetical protein